MNTESPPLALVGEAHSVGVDCASPVLVRLGAERASLFVPVACSLLAGLGAGGDVHLSADGLVLAGPAGDAGARVAVATAVAGVAADLDRVRSDGQPATLALSPRPVPIDSGECFVMHGLIRHGCARDDDLYSDLVERLARKVLSESADVALTRGPLFARLDVDDERFLAVLALVRDRAFVRRLGGPTGFLDALRDAAYRTFFRSWADPSGVEFLADAPGPGSAVVSTLPLLGASREDWRGYRSHLACMLGSSARALFGTLNEAYARIVPEGGALRAVVPDFGPRGDEHHLQVFCKTELRYGATRAALLAQLVQGCLGRLAACGCSASTPGRWRSIRSLRPALRRAATRSACGRSRATSPSRRPKAEATLTRATRSRRPRAASSLRSRASRVRGGGRPRPAVCSRSRGCSSGPSGTPGGVSTPLARCSEVSTSALGGPMRRCCATPSRMRPVTAPPMPCTDSCAGGARRDRDRARGPADVVPGSLVQPRRCSQMMLPKLPERLSALPCRLPGAST